MGGRVGLLGDPRGEPTKLTLRFYTETAGDKAAEPAREGAWVGQGFAFENARLVEQ